jgi:hypothetical protein
MRKMQFAILASLMVASLWAAPLTPAQKTLVDAQVKAWSYLGTDPVVVKAVKDYAANPPAELKGMTQDKWAKLSLLSPEIKLLSKNDLTAYLRSKRTDIVAELFVSTAGGDKVSFFGKTTSWNHKGKPKHDVPMTGKTWTGESEMDESSGKTTVQISFPVMDGGKPIGSIVIGLDMALLK